MENKWKNQTFFKALKNALNGIIYTIKTQRNIKIQSSIAIIAILCGFLFNLTNTEWVILTITIFLVLITELFNTAIETVVDMYTEEYNEKAKIAKDVSSGAVLMMSICSVCIGLILFVPKIIKLFLI